MPLLAVILFPLLIAVLVLVIQGLSHVAHRQGQVMPAMRRSLIIKVADAFKRETTILWGPSILLLEAIAAPGPGWRRESSLLPLYRSLSRRYPELYEGIGLALYLEFLAKADLIAHRNRCVCLSAVGAEFLRVVTNNRQAAPITLDRLRHVKVAAGSAGTSLRETAVANSSEEEKHV